MNKRLMVVVTGLLLAAGSMQASAGGFIRGEAGRSSVDADVTDLGSDGDSDTAYSIRGGYYFNKNFAVEAFYSKFYDQSVEIDDGVDTITVSGKLSGIGLGVVGKTDFGNDQTGFFLSGRVGVMRGKVEVSATGYGSASDTSTKPYFGVGAGYDFSDKVGLSLNIDQHKGSGEDVSIDARTITLGLEVRF
jgi:OOP family OmpA-OmpF porin